MFDPKNFQFKLVEPNRGGNALGQHGQTVTFENGRVSVDGKRIDLSLLPSDVHLPQELPTYLAGYKPFGFRADELSPVIMVSKDEDWHRDFSKENAFKRVNVKVGPRGNIPEVDPDSSLTKYKAVDRLLGAFVPTVTEDNAAGSLYKPRQVAMKRVGWALSLDRELDVMGPAGLLTQSGNWNANNVVTLGSTTKWNGGASSDPLGNLDTIITNSAQEVTEIWMNQIVALTFLKHPSVRDQMRQLLGDNAAPTAIGEVWAAGRKSVNFMIPGYPPFKVAAAKVLNETTGNLDYVLPNHAIVITKPPGVPTDGEEVATSYTFRVRGNVGVGYETREFRVEGRGQKGGVMVVVYQSDIAQFTGNNCGGAVFGAVQ